MNMSRLSGKVKVEGRRNKVRGMDKYGERGGKKKGIGINNHVILTHFASERGGF